MRRYNQKLGVWEYDEGDEVWIVPGCRHDHLIVVRCKITEVNRYFRERHPDAYLFYVVDEPIGHDLADDDLYATQEEAMQAAREIAEEEKKYLFEEYSLDELVEHESDLERYRRSTLDFIKSTWVNAGYGDEWKEPTYPAKEKDKDWFSFKSYIAKE